MLVLLFLSPFAALVWRFNLAGAAASVVIVGALLLGRWAWDVNAKLDDIRTKKACVLLA